MLYMECQQRLQLQPSIQLSLERAPIDDFGRWEFIIFSLPSRRILAPELEHNHLTTSRLPFETDLEALSQMYLVFAESVAVGIGGY